MNALMRVANHDANLLPDDGPSERAIQERADDVYAYFARNPNKRPAALAWHLDTNGCNELATTDLADTCELGRVVAGWIDNGLKGMAYDYAERQLWNGDNPERVP
jgi:hypothetical protein